MYTNQTFVFDHNKIKVLNSPYIIETNKQNNTKAKAVTIAHFVCHTYRLDVVRWSDFFIAGAHIDYSLQDAISYSLDTIR